ncbi:MAG: hypothetical protein AAF690_01010 [Acidobacteriota bacterium]
MNSSFEGIERPRCVLVKLGGSLITDKTGHRAVRRGVLRSLAEDLAGFLSQASPDLRVLLGHGSGSFGHTAAAGTALVSASRVPGDRTAAAVVTQEAAAALHQFVVEELIAAEVPAFSLAPGSFLVTRGGVPEQLFAAPLVEALRAGAHVVVHGDVATDREAGFRIVSTETVLQALVDDLSGELEVLGALWLGETAGLLDADGHTIPEIDSSQDVEELIGVTRGTDVTGGMAHRIAVVQRMARSGVTSFLLDGRKPGRFRSALEHIAASASEALDGATRIAGDD